MIVGSLLFYYPAAISAAGLAQPVGPARYKSRLDGCSGDPPGPPKLHKLVNLSRGPYGTGLIVWPHFRGLIISIAAGTGIRKGQVEPLAGT